MLKKPRKRITPKQRDPSWKLRHALGHKVEPNPKAYTCKRTHPEVMRTEEASLPKQFIFRVLSLQRLRVDEPQQRPKQSK